MPARSMDLTPEEILEGATKQTSQHALAAALQVSQGGLNTKMQQLGIREEVNKRLSARRAELKPERVMTYPVDEEISEEETLQQRIDELEKAARKRRKRDVFEQRVVDALAGAVETRKPVYSPRPIPKSKRNGDKHEFVLLWSDLHAGEIVSKEETNGVNEYDWEIMLRRHDRLREALFSYQDNRSFPVEHLRIFALGDMLSGDIHDELVETNEVPLAEATVQLGLDGAEWIESLTERFQKISFAGVVGNHPRAKRKPQAKRQFDNADWIAYHTMRLRLRENKRIAFEVPKAGMWPVMVARNWRVLLWHGDGIRSTMPGVPWGGVMRRAAALQNQYTAIGQPIDCFTVGHFHQGAAVEGSAGDIILNGSVKGPDEYSIKQFGGGRPPRQTLLTFHPKQGLTEPSRMDLE